MKIANKKMIGNNNSNNGSDGDDDNDDEAKEIERHGIREALSGLNEHQ